jgi:serine/threonine-protein kinase
MDDSLLGRRVADRYLVRDIIGRGAMGEVYEAEQLSTGRRCALKVLRPELLANLHVLARFEREAQLASRLTHPHTVVVYDSGRDGDRLFIAMELLPGRHLEAEIRGGPLPPARAVHMALQICASLAEAHRAGIVHRDLKPNNILLIDRAGDPDYVKVCDFGIARQYEGGAAQTGLTTDGLVYGTPNYMSPEQLRGQPLDGRSDIYALGVILYEMLTGLPPFRADSVIELANKHLVEDPPPFRRWGEATADAVGDRLELVVRRALAKTVEERWPSMDEMAGALRAADPGARGAARARPGSGRSAAAPTDRVAGLGLHGARLWLMAALALLLAGGGVAGAVVLIGARLAVEEGPSPVPPGLHVPPGKVKPAARDGAGDEGASAPASPAPAPAPAPVPPSTVTLSIPVPVPVPTPASAPAAATAGPASEPAGPPGKLTLNAKPWAEVLEGKHLLGTTPLVNVELSPGRHVLTLVNEKLGVTRRLIVVVKPGADVRHPLVDLTLPERRSPTRESSPHD